MQFLKKKPILRYLVLGLLAVLVGVNLFWLNASRLAGNAVPMPFGVGASVVLSGSMEPTLSVGDLLLLRQESSYQEGDIVVYQSGNMAVVHRIVSLEGETVITQGDANNVPDEAFAVHYIKGRVAAAIPLVGYAVWLLKTPAGIIATIAAAVLLVELSYRREKQEKEDETEKLKAEIRQLLEELGEDGRP